MTIQDQPPPPNPYRWVMLGLLWLIYAGFGLVSRSIFPLISPLLRDLHISYTQMGFILGSWQLTYIVAALFSGSILDRWGVRKALLAGAVIMGLSAALRYFTVGFSTLLTMVALFGAGGPMISIGGPKTIAEWFQGKDRGTAIGIYMTGPTIGGLVAFSLTNSLVMPLTGYNWRMTFVCYGLITCGAGILWWLFSRESLLDRTGIQMGIKTVFLALLRVRNVLILLIMALFSFSITHGFTSWLPNILENSGLSAAMAGYAASLPLASGLPALLFIPPLIPSSWRGRFIALCALLTAVNVLLVVNVSGAWLVAGLIFLGLTSTPLMPMMLLILMDSREVEAKYMGSAGGLYFCVAEIGGFTGPLAMGVLVDITGTFTTGAFFLAATALAISLLTIFLRD
jgi:CP family cyanate transporter-like MFS transporter